jgi:hypothetical protein
MDEMAGTAVVFLTAREIKGIRTALIFGMPDDMENAPELVSAIRKLREANEALDQMASA